MFAHLNARFVADKIPQEVIARSLPDTRQNDVQLSAAIGDRCGRAMTAVILAITADNIVC